MNQPALFDNDDQADNYQRPAHINPQRCGQSIYNYMQGCRCEACRETKRRERDRNKRGVRVCRQCGREYVKHTTPDALNVYCSTTCRNTYANRRKKTRVELVCGGCGTTYTAKQSTRAHRWILCPDCLRTIEPNWSAFANHAVPAHLIHQFVKDPTCPICHERITGRTKSNKGTWIPVAVVDHDHACCPRSNSCGKCVRGILCRECNKLLPDRPNITGILTAAINYIQRWDT